MKYISGIGQEGNMSVNQPFGFAFKYAGQSLPTRRVLVRHLLMLLFTALLCMGEIGLIVGKSLWHTPFALQGVEKWVPFILLFSSAWGASDRLRRIIDGAYLGGAMDPFLAGERQAG